VLGSGFSEVRSEGDLLLAPDEPIPAPDGCVPAETEAEDQDADEEESADDDASDEEEECRRCGNPLSQKHTSRPTPQRPPARRRCSRPRGTPSRSQRRTRLRRRASCWGSSAFCFQCSPSARSCAVTSPSAIGAGPAYTSPAADSASDTPRWLCGASSSFPRSRLRTHRKRRNR